MSMMRSRRPAGMSASSFTFLKTCLAGSFSFPAIWARSCFTWGSSSGLALKANSRIRAPKAATDLMKEILKRDGTNPKAKMLRRNNMQRTVRALRIALPIAFIAFAAILYVSWDVSKSPQKRPEAEAVTSTQRPEDDPQAEARAFRDVQTIGGRVVSEIVAERVVSFKSGWTTLEGVTLTLYRDNGLTYVISCPSAEFNSATD